MKPDLVEIAVGDPPIATSRGGSFVIVDEATNSGPVGALPSTTLYYLSYDVTDRGRDQPLIGQRSVPALAPMSTSTGAVTLTVADKTVPGTYFILACADDRHDVQEEDERNNCAVSNRTTTVLP